MSLSIEERNIIVSLELREHGKHMTILVVSSLQTV